MITVWIILAFLIFFTFFLVKKEDYANTALITKYDDLTVSQDGLKEQRYLHFLSDVNDSVKEQMPKTGVFRGSCDDKVNIDIQKKVLNRAYMKVIKDNGLIKDFQKDVCVSAANYLCEMTDPTLYLSQSRMPPRWMMKSYRDVHLPKNTDLACFVSNYNCCKKSMTNL
jgi:hypothetical protein